MQTLQYKQKQETNHYKKKKNGILFFCITNKTKSNL